MTLTKTESTELATCEEVIQRGLSNFIEVGNALATIRDGKLYKSTHKTFEDYCREKWEISKMQGHRLMNAANAVANLESNQLVTPRSESVIRPLTKLPPAAQQEVWKEAVETAPEGKVTAKHVEQTAKRWEPGTNSLRAPSKEAIEADSESDAIFQLKRWWKKAAKKDRKKFLRWVKSSGE